MGKSTLLYCVKLMKKSIKYIYKLPSHFLLMTIFFSTFREDPYLSHSLFLTQTYHILEHIYLKMEADTLFNSSTQRKCKHSIIPTREYQLLRRKSLMLLITAKRVLLRVLWIRRNLCILFYIHKIRWRKYYFYIF